MSIIKTRVKKVACIDKSRLEITFQNGEVKIFDVTPYFQYPIFQNLQDEAFFRKAHVLHGTVAWNEYIDFDPATLYEEGKELARRD